MTNNPQVRSLDGQTFGRLKVTSVFESIGRGRVYWLCGCECGNVKWILGQSLTNGATQSCGCLNDEQRRKGVHRATAGGKHTPEYASWHGMKQRCLNPRNARFEYYGGRGIKICKRWKNSFTNFLADMGSRPANMTLGRIKNDGNYSRKNCEWQSNASQSRETSRNKKYTFGGETLCCSDWAKRIGIKPHTLRTRLQRWPIERALTEAKN